MMSKTKSINTRKCRARIKPGCKAKWMITKVDWYYQYWALEAVQLKRIYYSVGNSGEETKGGGE